MFLLFIEVQIFTIKLWESERNEVNFGKGVENFRKHNFSSFNLKPSSHFRLVSVSCVFTILKLFKNLKAPYKVGISVTKRKKTENYDKNGELLKWKINLTKNLARNSIFTIAFALIYLSSWRILMIFQELFK